MIRLRVITSLFLIVMQYAAAASTVDTVVTYSASMKKEIKAVIIKPDNYASSKALPVVYLLHGYSGNYADWISKVPSLAAFADEYTLMIVCPDGNFAGWYFNSPVDSSVRYETYISKELINFIDTHYKSIADKKGRAITGLSMGGHGALYLAFKHQDVFGAAGSMSGGVDIRPFPGNWGISNLLGTYKEHPENWENNTVINLTHLLTPNSLALIIDCGSDDFFYRVNVAFHEKLLYNNIPHDFISRPGGHSWDYWGNSIKYQLLFMHEYFIKAK